MTAAEAHQQDLEHQQWLAEFDHIKSDMQKNHGKFIGIARSIRDTKSDSVIEVALQYLSETLEEYEELNRRFNEHARSA